MACATVIEEMLPLMPPDLAYEVLDFGLHLVPANLKVRLQEAIDAALQLDQLSPEARLANAMYLIKQREFRQAALTLRQLTQDARAPLFVQNRARRLLEQIRPE